MVPLPGTWDDKLNNQLDVRWGWRMWGNETLERRYPWIIPNVDKIP